MQLLDAVIKARDPEGRFAAVEAVQFPIELAGLYFDMHFNQSAFCREGVVVTVWTKTRKVVFDNFPKVGLRSTYVEDRVYTEDASGNVVESIERPLDQLATSFGGLTLQIIEARILPTAFGKALRYNPLVHMSFFGYALINYVLFPSNLTDPTQIESVEQTGPFELTTTYHPSFATHSRVQTYRFDPKTKLLTDHYYRVSYINDALKAWHRIERHDWAGGIAFGARRRIRLSAVGRPGQLNTLELIRADVGEITIPVTA